eukprot:TRINITY_DN48812_c0_g1_i1.p1 TRINITY_DN48812_c0_g1~~TRINITY_DN48812_c0_g1_i1.p1  ORF type:complete len:659 (-),score=49.44 TRINITY_DN48812_c0_g1_i1:273-2249(-)
MWVSLTRCGSYPTAILIFFVLYTTRGADTVTNNVVDVLLGSRNHLNALESSALAFGVARSQPSSLTLVVTSQEQSARIIQLQSQASDQLGHLTVSPQQETIAAPMIVSSEPTHPTETQTVTFHHALSPQADSIHSVQVTVGDSAAISLVPNGFQFGTEVVGPFTDITISQDKLWLLTEERGTVYTLQVQGQVELDQTYADLFPQANLIAVHADHLYLASYNTIKWWLLSSVNTDSVQQTIELSTDATLMLTHQHGLLLAFSNSTTPTTSGELWWMPKDPVTGELQDGIKVRLPTVTNTENKADNDNAARSLKCTFGHHRTVQQNAVVVYCIESQLNTLHAVLFTDSSGTVQTTLQEGQNMFTGNLVHPVAIQAISEEETVTLDGVTTSLTVDRVVILGNNGGKPYVSQFVTTHYSQCADPGDIPHATRVASEFGSMSYQSSLSYTCTESWKFRQPPSSPSSFVSPTLSTIRCTNVNSTSEMFQTDGAGNSNNVVSEILETNSDWDFNLPTCLGQCQLKTDNCHADAVCRQTSTGTALCLCREGFFGDGVHCDIDECIEKLDNCDPDYGVCTNSPGSFSCGCVAGFQSFDHVCSDLNECSAGTHVCDRHAICTNTPGSFKCKCLDGFVGDGITCSGAMRMARTMGCVTSLLLLLCSLLG